MFPFSRYCATKTHHLLEELTVVVASDVADAEGLQPALFALAYAEQSLMHLAATVVRNVLNDPIEYSVGAIALRVRLWR
jgi:hypothetical protein